MSMTEGRQVHERAAAKGERYEPRDISPRHILYGSAVLFGGIVVSFAAVSLFVWLIGPMKEQRREAALPPSPRLEVAEPADRAAIEARANARLQGYGWTDRAAGRAHIPIDRAMDMLAKQGWPDAATAGPPGQPDPADPASEQMREGGKKPGAAGP